MKSLGSIQLHGRKVFPLYPINFLKNITGFPQAMDHKTLFTRTIFLISLLHVILPPTAATAYNTTDIIQLNCGAPANTTTLDDRSWEADIHSKYFPVSPGPKFLRLYFYPEEYTNLDMTASFFSVTANSYTLLKNFSAHLTVSAMHAASLIKEFIVTVRDYERLNVTFTPSPNSQAFINAIEIVSISSILSTSGYDINIPCVTADRGIFLTLENTTTLETLHRLNISGKQIEKTVDTGMYRTWRPDEVYLAGGSKWTPPLLQKFLLHFKPSTPAYTTPEEVYISSRMMSKDASFNLETNMTWIFPVDAGFNYLVRLHFCELLREVTGRDQHVFDISINNQTVETPVDVFLQSVGNGFPMAQSGSDSQSCMASFATEKSESKVTSTILPIVGAILGGFVQFSLVLSFFVFQRQRKLKDTSNVSTTKTSSSKPSYLGCHFSVSEIKAATQDFNYRFLIGCGGFGHIKESKSPP
ncbi:hypothetical protein SLEP1_g56879 [Rubroshorea leprosula]|uniref:Malectin-like domain-containing protein n=1 Tax=Rubroshorea leprosula TaxID=152421 RepID=A0AAV5MJK7_9ROSI|nr:hypothetical protein SLEP1_g56879 [Rubroshorea leprosula]